MGAVHPSLCNKDVRFMKTCTIILICMMTLALIKSQLSKFGLAYNHSPPTTPTTKESL